MLVLLRDENPPQQHGGPCLRSSAALPLGINGKEYPAPGGRGDAEGGFWHIGNIGNGWSSSSNRTDGMHLGFGTQDLGPGSSYHRASGLQLRCLSE